MKRNKVRIRLPTRHQILLRSLYGKDGSQALVKSEVREAIPEAKCSDEALRKRMERSEKIISFLIV
jgi:hypothetical protein